MNPQTIKLASPDFVWRWLLHCHRYCGMLSFVLVVIGSAVWWAVSGSPRSGSDPAQPVPTRMVWLGELTRPDAARLIDTRTILSPVLFALPTPAGFSRGALSANVSATGLTATQEAANGHILPPPSSSVAFISRTTPQEAAVAARMLAWPQDEAEPRQHSTGSYIVVAGQFAGTIPQPRSIPAPTNSIWIDAQSWEAVARVSLDEQGWPLRVLLEKATTMTNRNLQIVQLLRTMNFGAVGARDGRVAVRYEGSGGRP